MKRFDIVYLCLVLWLGGSGSAHAQNYVYAIGNQALSTQIPIENGFINVNNGEIHLEIPLATHPQRGRLQLNEKLVYDSRIWKIVANGGYSWQPTNVPNSMGGWVFSSGLQSGTYTYNTYPDSFECNGPANQMPFYQYWNFRWTDPTGAVHEFPSTRTQYYNSSQLPVHCLGYSGNPVGEIPTSSGWASDGSGYSATVTNYTTLTIKDPQGNLYYPTVVANYPPPGVNQVADSNGNYWSQDANGNLVDTEGRTPILVTTSGNLIYYDVLGYGGTRNRYTVTTETVYFNTLFFMEAVAEAQGSFTAIKSIQLPNGTSYSFTYDSSTSSDHYGELTGVTLPSGGTITYSYINFYDSFKNANRWIYTRVKDGGTTTFTPSTISLCSSSSGCQEKNIVTSPSGSDTVYTFTLDKGALENAGSWSTAIDVYQGTSLTGTKLKSQTTSYTYNTFSFVLLEGGTNNVAVGSYQVPSTVTTNTTLPDAGVTTQVVTTLDSNPGRPSSIKRWDYYPSSGSAPSTPALETDYTYYGLFPAQITEKTGTGGQISQTTYTYDETTGAGHAALTTTSGLLNHNAASGTRYNLTTTAKWINTTGGTLNAEGSYDDTGFLLTSTDSNGKTTNSFDASHTWATTVTPPTPSSGVALPTSFASDPSSGLMTSTTDPNSTGTSYTGYDSFGRVGEIDVADSGGTQVGKTKYTYSTTQTGVQTYQSASVYRDAETLYDSYGRESRVEVSNGQSSNPWYQHDTCYDSSGRVSFRSYAYQGAGWSTPKVCSGAGDSYTYDALNRVTKIIHGDGTAINYTYTGRATKVVDENGVGKITQIDGLGRQTSVCEISSSILQGVSPAACGLDLSGTGFTTTTSYDMAQHKITVTQGVQSRVFQTDSLGRTVLTQEPESGSTAFAYTYNSIGLVVTRTRPKANQSNASVTTTTTTQYDAVGRVLSVTYSDGTPTKTFTYDVNVGWGDTQANVKGRLSDAATTATGTIFGYDPTGQVAFMAECVPLNCGTGAYGLNYSYDWAGNLKTSTDGSSVTSTYTYSPANELLSLTSSVSNSANPASIVSSVKNGPNGPSSYSLGNGLSSVYRYDSLGRLSGGWVCQGSTSASCTGGTTSYGFSINAQNGAQIQNVSDTVLNKSVSYGYDAFNRLTSSTVGSGTVQNFNYVYDRYGNRWQQNVTAGIGPQPQLSFDATNNKINLNAPCATPVASQYCYDAAGNMTSDGSHTYSYDAEGNVTAVDSGSTETFTYNALNQVVQASIQGFLLETVYNAAGQRVSLWNGSTGTELRGQYYWGSDPVAYYYSGSTHFQHQDWLGTERMRTSYTGAVEGSFTNLAFGDLKTTIGSDSDAYHFAGLDEDVTTGADHAQFRQYASAEGRWMAPDPYGGSYDFSNPQSLNRYVYVMNNPLVSNDPSGLCGDDPFCGGNNLIPWPIQILECWFGFTCGEHFTGSLKPRPDATGDPNWDGNFGESLGISTKIPQGNWGIATALGLPDSGCEFGGCGSVGQGFAGIDSHHVLPQQFVEWFTERGLNIENYKIPLLAAAHRLKPNGIHTKLGGNWNKVWAKWIEEHPNATPEAILEQAKKMLGAFGIVGGDIFSEFFIIVNPCSPEVQALPQYNPANYQGICGGPTG